WMVQKMFFGPVSRKENQGLQDLNLREIATALPFIVLVLVMGLKPQPLLDVINSSTDHYVAPATLSDLGVAKMIVQPAPTPARSARRDLGGPACARHGA